MINVTKTYLPIFEDYQSILRQIWQAGWLTNGGRFEKELALSLQQYLGVGNLELVANGMLALQLSIKALDLSGEIITTPFSYVATASAIAWEGLKPIFVDVEEKTFCIDARLIESAITENTSAILATHVYGYPCDVDEIEAVAEKHRLKVIYDAAHCFNVKLNGHSLLHYGDASILSFHATKLFHTGEGGAVICRDDAVSKRVHLMKKFGHIGEDDYFEIGTNAKMSELHAAMGLCVLPKANEIIARRREISGWYDDYLAGQDLQRPLLRPGLEYNYSYYPVVFRSHQTMLRVRQALIDNGIMPRRYFFPSLNTLPFLQQAGFHSCPISESLAMRVLSLPLYFELEKMQVEKIARVIARSIK